MTSRIVPAGFASQVFLLHPRNSFLARLPVWHLRRDLRDVGLSWWMTHFKHIRWACDLEHIGTRIRQYLRLMDHFRRVLRSIERWKHFEDVLAPLFKVLEAK
jgi:hypothetical protein